MMTEFRCRYFSLGCEKVATNASEETSHSSSCSYKLFASCFNPGCEEVADFKSLNEYVDHIRTVHGDKIIITGNDKLETSCWVKEQHLTDPAAPSFIRLMGVIESNQKYVNVEVAIFVLFGKTYGGTKVVTPFGIILYREEDDGSLMPVVELDFKFIGKNGVMPTESRYDQMPNSIYPSAYHSIRSLANDWTSLKRYVLCRTILDMATAIESESSTFNNVHFGFKVNATFTRMSAIGIAKENKRFMCDWTEVLGPSPGWNRSVQTLLLEGRGLEPLGITRGLLSIQSEGYRTYILETGESHRRVLLPLVIYGINAAHREEYQQPFRMANEPVLQLPRKAVPHKRPRYYDFKGNAVPYSCSVLIVVETEILSHTLAATLAAYFPDLNIHTGFDMVSALIRNEAVLFGIDILVTTTNQLHSCLQPVGEHLVGSSTRLVVFMNMDRLLTKRFINDTVEFLVPQVTKEFQRATKVFVLPKLLPEHADWLESTITSPLVSIGRISGMGLEHLTIKVKKVWSDFEKQPKLCKFLKKEAKESRNTGVQKRIIIFAKAKEEVKVLKSIVRAKMHGFIYKAVTAESVKGDLTKVKAKEIQDFLQRDKVVLITTTLMALSVDVPLVETVVVDGLYCNICELYRQASMTKDKLFVVVNKSYGGSHNDHFAAFLEECKKWRS